MAREKERMICYWKYHKEAHVLITLGGKEICAY